MRSVLELPAPTWLPGIVAAALLVAPARADVITKRPSTHSFPPAEFEAMYRENLKRRKKWVSQFIAASQVAAE